MKGAHYDRDYLLPAPSNNYRGFKNKELKYQTAFAIQTQIISLASYRVLRIFQSHTGHFHTPHSDRNFMPSAMAVLGFSETDRDILGGKSAEGSERYSRAAQHKIAAMQTAMAMTFKNPDLTPLVKPTISMHRRMMYLGQRRFSCLARIQTSKEILREL